MSSSNQELQELLEDAQQNPRELLSSLHNLCLLMNMANPGEAGKATATTQLKNGLTTPQKEKLNEAIFKALRAIPAGEIELDKAWRVVEMSTPLPNPKIRPQDTEELSFDLLEQGEAKTCYQASINLLCLEEVITKKSMSNWRPKVDHQLRAPVGAVLRGWQNCPPPEKLIKSKDNISTILELACRYQQENVIETCLQKLGNDLKLIIPLLSRGSARICSEKRPELKIDEQAVIIPDELLQDIQRPSDEQEKLDRILKWAFSPHQVKNLPLKRIDEVSSLLPENQLSLAIKARYEAEKQLKKTLSAEEMQQIVLKSPTLKLSKAISKLFPEDHKTKKEEALPKLQKLAMHLTHFRESFRNHPGEERLWAISFSETYHLFRYIINTVKLCPDPEQAYPDASQIIAIITYGKLRADDSLQHALEGKPWSSKVILKMIEEKLGWDDPETHELWLRATRQAAEGKN